MTQAVSSYVTGTVSGYTRKIRTYIDYTVNETNASYAVSFSAGFYGSANMRLDDRGGLPTITVTGTGQQPQTLSKECIILAGGSSVAYIPETGTLTWTWPKTSEEQTVSINVQGTFGTSSAFKGKKPTVNVQFTIPAGIVKPEINDMLAFRSDSEGVSDNEGTYAHVQANLKHAKYYDADDGWTECSISGVSLEIGSQTLTPTISGTAFDYISESAVVSSLGTEYSVSLTVTYLLPSGSTISATRTTTISKSDSFVIDIMPEGVDGPGIAFGKEATGSGFECDMSMKYSGMFLEAREVIWHKDTVDTMGAVTISESTPQGGVWSGTHAPTWFDEIEVYYAWSTSYGNLCDYVRAPSTKTIKLAIASQSNNRTGGRQITPTSSGFTVEAADYNTGSANTHAIPIKIVGIKHTA